MKSLILALAIIAALASLSSAQETYTLNFSAGNVSDLTAIVAAKNERTCLQWSLAVDCTQAQACTAVGLAPGCSAAQARNAGARIFPATQAGREEYVFHTYVIPGVKDQRPGVPARHREKMCDWWSTANQTQKDSTCTSVGQNAGCELCP
jgi:hypothetical protein